MDTIFLGITFAFEKNDPSVMQQPPQPLDEAILPFPKVISMTLLSITMMALSIFLFQYLLPHYTLAMAQTATVHYIISASIFLLFSISSSPRHILTNKKSLMGILGIILVQLLLHSGSFLSPILHTAPINLSTLIIIFALSLLLFGLAELLKYMEKYLAKK